MTDAAWAEPVVLEPIGRVSSPRAEPLDDDWGGIVAEISLDAGRFTPQGAWREPPEVWSDDIVERLAAPAMAARIREALGELPHSQREVVTLRDVEGLTSSEVCDLLDISEGNQRVLLHRGRSRVRAMLEDDVRKWET